MKSVFRNKMGGNYEKVFKDLER
jgi:hypothetical protein